jgi:UDP-N-acetylmuramate--alanine ligase
MHIYFSGIGGAGIGPLAQVALEAGYEVSGSDKQSSSYIEYLSSHGLSNIHIGQSLEEIQRVHEEKPIDWFVYSSALTLENPNAPELEFCKEQDIKFSKRDELLNQILKDQNLSLIAIAGTHGKTTTTAMVTWLFHCLNQPVSYLLPAKTSFADMGKFSTESKYFIYEADEFDRNFLSFEPKISLISGVSWDHHEIFPTREDYQQAFKEFIDQSSNTFIWQEDADYLNIESSESVEVLNSSSKDINTLSLVGKYNRLDAYLAAMAVHFVTQANIDQLISYLNDFPGLSRRMEKIRENLYSDYAHTPEKIRGAMSVAQEMAGEKGQDLVIVYEPLTNRRQHYIMDNYKDCFDGAAKLYWLPSYLAREDKNQRIIAPEELISHLDNPRIAEAKSTDNELKEIIEKHIEHGDMVVAMAGGGGNSLDDWIRQEFMA